MIGYLVVLHVLVYVLFGSRAHTSTAEIATVEGVAGDGGLLEPAGRAGRGLLSQFF